MGKRLAIWGATLLLAASVAGATSIIKMEFADMIADSDRIVIGTVTGIEGQWDDSSTFIHSMVTISVETSLQGKDGGDVVLRTPGGQVGGFAMSAQGAPSFTVGERVLVFLTTWEDGTPKVLGYFQGKSRLVDGADGKPRLEGGAANGRSLDNVARELQLGTYHNIPLQPAR
jgi:hypothetical protein